jgi:hypothetical protein
VPAVRRIPKAEIGGVMGYKKFCYWVDSDGLEKVRNNLEEREIEPTDESRIPCRVLKASTETGFIVPSAWYGFCKRRTSWYWESEKAGKTLVVSKAPIVPLDGENPIVITESNFKPDRLPLSGEITQLIESQEFQKRKPRSWENVEPIEKDFYQTWFERNRPTEPFDFDKIFTYHSANHANFLDPTFFLTLNGAISPYSIADSIHVCSSCVEFFNILGRQWPIKYVVPCIGAVLFAHLPMDHYFEVKVH